MPGHQHDHFIYATLTELGAELANHSPNPTAAGAADEEALKAKFEAKLAVARSAFATAVGGGTNPFSFHGHSFWVDTGSRYIFPESMRPGSNQHEKYDSKFGYQDYGHWSVATLRDIAMKLARNEPVEVISLTMFLAAMVAEAHRNIVTEVTNQLVMGSGTPENTAAFAATGGVMPMTTGGTVSPKKGGPLDPTIDDVRQGSAPAVGKVTDQEVEMAKSYYERATGTKLADYLDEHGEIAAAKTHIKTTLRSQYFNKR